MVVLFTNQAISMGHVTTRQRIVEEASRLFYERGYEATSFTDIAQAVQISRGNFYHHFKTKDDILDAVIELRIADTRDMLQTWEDEGDSPLARIHLFVEILVRNRPAIMAHGCPVGTLTMELAKLLHPARPVATELFHLFKNWLTRQFTDLDRAQDAEQLALHVLSWSQGVAVLGSALSDAAFMEAEVAGMRDWVTAQSDAHQLSLPHEQ